MKDRQTLYKDLDTGITHYAKHKADAAYASGRRILVLSQNRRTRKTTPLCEWIPGSVDYCVFRKYNGKLQKSRVHEFYA